MKTKNLPEKSVVLLVLVLFMGAIIAFGGVSSTQVAAQASTTTTSPPILTTLEDIIAGKFPSATDKSGTGGVLVQVDNLTVLSVHTEADGDWHVDVTDRKQPIFITEVIPRDQARLGQPPTGSVITEIGTPYCDTVHQTELWHGYTCWEIHPVTNWMPYTPVPEFTVGQSQVIFVSIVTLLSVLTILHNRRHWQHR